MALQWRSLGVRMGLLEYSSALWAAAQANLDVFGAMGLAFGFATSLMSRRMVILMTSAACGVCFSLHYLRLGSATGMAMAAIAVAQSLLAARYITLNSRPAWLNPTFAASMVLVVALTLATWNGWPSVFAGVGALFATAARLQTSAHIMRLLLLCATLCCAGHNTIVGSACGLTCDVLAILGFAVTMAHGGLFSRPTRLRASHAGG